MKYKKKESKKRKQKSQSQIKNLWQQKYENVCQIECIEPEQTTLRCGTATTTTTTPNSQVVGSWFVASLAGRLPTEL